MERKTWGYAPAGVAALIFVGLLIWVISGGWPLFEKSGHDLKGEIQDAGDNIKLAGRDAAESIRRTVH